jgi:DNA-binding NarL/FixJ family response regulator
VTSPEPDPEPAAPTSVVLCDDAVGFPLLVQRTVQDAPDLRWLGAADSHAALLDLLATVTPDVVLLDVVLPDGTTDAAFVGEVRRRAPGARIVLVSSMDAADLRRLAADSGADGSASKGVRLDELLALVRPTDV